MADFVNNNKFISHHVIHADLARKFKTKTFHIDDIEEWCFIAESRYIIDIRAMVQILGISLSVEFLGSKPIAYLPCNVIRILDVYLPNEKRIPYVHNGAFLYLSEDFTGDTVMLNYIGSPIDVDGGSLIIKGHENACEQYCKLQAFEEDWINGKINQNAYVDWQRTFSGMMQNISQDVKNLDMDKLNKLDIIRGNMIPRIGRLVLSQNQFSSNSNRY